VTSRSTPRHTQGRASGLAYDPWTNGGGTRQAAQRRIHIFGISAKSE
jgi:hypothetical protein